MRHALLALMTSKVVVVLLIVLCCLASGLIGSLITRAVADHHATLDSDMLFKLREIAQHVDIEKSQGGSVSLRVMDAEQRDRIRIEMADSHAGVKVLDLNGSPSLSLGYEPYGASCMINGTDKRQGVLLQSDADGARLLILRGNVPTAELSRSTSSDGLFMLRDDQGVEQCSLWSTSQGVAMCIGQREGPRSIALTYNSSTKEVIVRGKDGSVVWQDP